jgi:nickel transport protein
MAQRLMNYSMHGLALVLLCAVCLLCWNDEVWAGSDQPAQAVSEQGSPQRTEAEVVTDCRQLAELVQQQRNYLSREIGQLKREIAALRDDLGKPGIKEIFAGIGYIFGLAGVGLYIHQSRRDRTRTET